METIQVYLTNAKSVVEYDADPNYAVFAEEGQDEFWLGQGYIYLGQVSVQFPSVPARDELAARTVEALKAKIQEVRANAEAQVNALSKSINDLRMLGYNIPSER